MECMSFAACGEAKECNPRYAFSPSEAQRSGFVRKRRSDGMHELCRLRRSEGMQSATTWGRTGFDGDAEIGIAGGCAYHP